MTILEVNKLSKSFGSGSNQTDVIKEVSFKVEKGEFVSIMGQSGSGKSTLLYSISGMDSLSSGDVKINDISLRDKTDKELSELRLNHMGFVFQDNYLLKNLNLEDNICLPALKSNSQSYETIQSHAHKLMKEMSIHDVKDHAINQVSGGQLQRAAVCRALINKPSILFTDEPTGALNSKSTKDVLKILNQLNQEGTTILVVTHDPSVAAVTDRIIYLNDGCIEDELLLGKYSDALYQKRYEKSVSWLLDKGF